MLEPVISRIDKWRRLGAKESDDGSAIIAHTPRKFPQAYLHAIFAAKEPVDWASYLTPLPRAVESFYWHCNGLRFFSELSVYGIRSRVYARDESAAFQPFDLLSHHDEQVRARRLSGLLFFGGYRSDGSSVAVSFDSAAVFGYRPKQTEPFFEWPDVVTFLTSEFDRLEAIHDSDGYPTSSLIPKERAQSGSRW